MATVTNMDKIIDNLIQSPGEARDSVVKALLIGENMDCKVCGTVYKTASAMESLSIYKYQGVHDPEAVKVFLECVCRKDPDTGIPMVKCGSRRTHTFRPNPFILSRRGAF